MEACGVKLDSHAMKADKVKFGSEVKEAMVKLGSDGNCWDPVMFRWREKSTGLKARKPPEVKNL